MSRHVATPNIIMLTTLAKPQRRALSGACAPSAAEGDSRRRAGRRILVIGVLVIIALAGALAAGTLPRLSQQQQLDAAATKAAAQPPRVTVAVAKRMAPS